MAVARKARPTPTAAPLPDPQVVGLTLDDITFEPDPPVATGDVRANLAWRGTGDTETLRVEYTWFRNGKKVYGHSRATLPAGNFARGDILGVEVTAAGSDGKKYTASRTGLRVANTAPRIVSSFKGLATFDGFQVQAEDADGDDVVYSLENPPPGFSIHPKTGRMAVLRGNYPGGVYHMVIHAKDAMGGDGTAAADVSMTIGEAPRIEEKTVAREVKVRDMTDDEYARRYGELVDKVEKMTDKDLEKLDKDLDRQEATPNR